MKGILIFFFSISLHTLFAQDKTVLEKQLEQILKDYPHQFKNLEDPDNKFNLKFRISGTTGNGIIMDGKYISAPLPVPESAVQASALFKEWVALVDQVSFGGVKMKGTPCKSRCGEFVEYQEKWVFDFVPPALNSDYLSFRIVVQVMKVYGSYAAAILIGNVN